MSGILDKKQRLIDFILTAEGYKQIENGDLRFVYATLTDADAIYDIKQGEYNVADLNSMPFSFEANSNFFDKVNSEIDLRQSANFALNTEINGQVLDLNQGGYKKTADILSIGIADVQELFDKMSVDFATNLQNQKIILTQNSIVKNSELSLYIDKINQTLYNKSDLINTESQILTIDINSNDLESYYTLTNIDNLDISKTSMIEDDRFQNKLNYLFLPPDNMNLNVVTKNNTIANLWNMAEDRRNNHKILFKNFRLNSQNDSTTMFEAVSNFNNLQIDDNAAILSAANLLNHIDNKISRFEIKFDLNQDIDTEFVLNLTELNIPDAEGTIFNKLLFVNHGEIFDVSQQKNKQIYSAGKLYNSKIGNKDTNKNDPDKLKNNNEDNYLFVSLFTIVVE